MKKVVGINFTEESLDFLNKKDISRSELVNTAVYAYSQLTSGEQHKMRQQYIKACAKTRLVEILNREAE